MAFGGGHFDAGHDVERVGSALAVCPQTCLQTVMVGDGDDVEAAVFGGVIHHLAGGGNAIADGSMHV